MSEPAGSPAPVLIVTPWYMPSVGGVVEVAERLHKGMLSNGIVSHLLVCDTQRRITRDTTTGENLWRFHIPGYAFNSLRPRAVIGMLRRAPETLWQLYRFIQDHRIGTVIVLHPTAFVWPFVILCRLLRLRLVLSLHGGDVRAYYKGSALSRRLFRRALRTADEVVVCSERLGEEVRTISPRQIRALRLIGNCVDVDYFTLPPPNHRRKDYRPTVVHISNFASVKRVLDIVDAFASQALPDHARLVMVGSGRDLEAAVTRARALGIQDRVVFAGSQEDVRPFLWDADLLVLASEAEGAPLVLLEAMACGVPWVSTRWGAAAELPPGECGLTIPSRDSDKIGEAIGELLRDPARRKIMGERARERVVAQYAERDYVRRHLKVLASR